MNRETKVNANPPTCPICGLTFFFTPYDGALPTHTSLYGTRRCEGSGGKVRYEKARTVITKATASKDMKVAVAKVRKNED